MEVPNLPDAQARPISDLLSDNELLDFRAANGPDIPFNGWHEVTLSLYDPKAKIPGSDDILVLVLVSRDVVQKTIIGFNAIEEMMKSEVNYAQPSDRVGLLRNSLRLGLGKAQTLLSLIQEATCESDTYTVKTIRMTTVVPGGQIKCISCPVETDLKVTTEMFLEKGGSVRTQKDSKPLQPHGGCMNGTEFHLVLQMHLQLSSVAWRKAWRASETKYASHSKMMS